MKKLSYLIVLALILGLVITGCTLLSNVGQVPTTGQSGIAYLTKEILYPELVALWHFDEGSEATTVADSSGNDNTGDIYDATPGEVGQFGNALSFDGNDYVMVPGSTSLSGINSAITVEIWLKFSNVTNAFYVRTPYDSEDSRAWGLDRLGGNLRFYIYDNNNYFICQKGWTPVVEQWYHIAGTYNGTTLKLYVDKELVKSFEHVGTIDSTDQGVVIGAKYSDGREGNLYGLIDEVRIWNTALSSEQFDSAIYDFGGILRPIKADGSSAFKQGSTVPVKFQLRDADGNIVTNAEACIFVTKVSNGNIGEMEAISTAAASTGNLFRYDPDSEQYIFNLATKSLSTGTWEIRIKLDDGTSKYVIIGLK